MIKKIIIEKLESAENDSQDTLLCSETEASVLSELLKKFSHVASAATREVTFLSKRKIYYGSWPCCEKIISQIVRCKGNTYK